MINILITGANGQLASCIKDLALNQTNLNFVYTDYLELNICDLYQLSTFFEVNKIDYCINCAVYTDVDKAKTEKEKAFQINAEESKNIAKVCALNNVILIHVSTDFVFDGQKKQLYNKIDEANPISIYGKTKQKGELEIINILKEHFIIRKSWLYSEHGNNFLKTILRLGESCDEIKVVNNQICTPTYARDLAQVILKLVNSKVYGIYCSTSEGVASWCDFAKAIFDISNVKVNVLPIRSEEYQALAMRRIYSVFDK